MKMKVAITLFTALCVTLTASAQKYYTKSGLVHFFSDAKMEDIKADNNSASCVVDAELVRWNGPF